MQRNIPLPPLQRGEERSEGGMLSLQRGEERSEALGKQTERKFRKWAQINANNCVCHSEHPLCHSERSEESREEEERDSSLTL